MRLGFTVLKGARVEIHGVTGVLLQLTAANHAMCMET
jgi:hypothetical protein